MKKSTVLSMVLGVVAVIGVGLSMADVGSVSIPQSYAQDMIAKKLPIEKTVSAVMFDMDIIVDKVDITFQENDILGVVAHATVNSRFGSAEVEVHTTGTPVFKNMAFYYLAETFEFEEFRLSAQATATAKTAGKIASNATKKFGKFMKKTGLLEGTGISVERTAEEMTAKIKEGAKPALEKIITRYLNKHPIKRLRGDKGLIVSLAIDKTEISAGTLTIHFSLLQFTMKIFLLAMLCLIAVLIAFFIGPYWFDV